MAQRICGLTRVFSIHNHRVISYRLRTVGFEQMSAEVLTTEKGWRKIISFDLLSGGWLCFSVLSTEV